MNSTNKEPLAPLYSYFKEDLKCVDGLILDQTQSDVNLVVSVARHLIQAGGKRIRPLLTIACNKLFSKDVGWAAHLAAAVELLHTATLLHDDVVDDSNLRRGEPTANCIWGNNPSILVGDFLLSKAFSLMIETKNISCLEVLAKATSLITEGEVLQLSISSDLNLPFESYLKIIKSKTAALFGASCQIGGMISHMPKNLEIDLYEFGYNLGIAFQMTDDILDYNFLGKDSGKSRGKDFFEGKVTLPVLLACQDQKTLEIWEKWFSKSTRTEGDLEEACKNLLKHKIFERCQRQAEVFTCKALDHLSKLPESPIRSMLEQLPQYCLNRIS